MRKRLKKKLFRRGTGFKWKGLRMWFDEAKKIQLSAEAMCYLSGHEPARNVFVAGDHVCRRCGVSL